MPEIETLITTTAGDFRTAPMPRSPLTRALWEQAAGDAARGRFDLLSLWGSGSTVYMALKDATRGTVGVVSCQARGGVFPSVGRLHAPAQRLERAVADLCGLTPTDAPDTRPWLDHGKWPVRAPLAARPGPAPAAPHAYGFLPAEGESLHQVAVGPVHAGIIEPGHFRFSAFGETVVRLEERFGYTHKGVDRLMQGATLARGAELAGRVSGDSTVAYAWAFAQAAEAALEVDVPKRALWLRALMAELERLANHLGDIGAICNDAAFAMMMTHCSMLREQVLRAAKATFGQRAMRDMVIPGGVTTEIDATGTARLRALMAELKDAFAALVDLYDNAASLLDRTVGAGQLAPALARRYAAGGYIGRASGHDFDTRRDLPYAPYDALDFDVPLREDGDVNARIWIRIREVQQSLSLVCQILARMPTAGAICTDLPKTAATREGLGLVEGFRGDILVWLALDGRGRIKRCHLRDPSWFQWPLLEAVIEGNIIADFPLCNKSFNCSYSGPDL